MRLPVFFGVLALSLASAGVRAQDPAPPAEPAPAPQAGEGTDAPAETERKAFRPLEGSVIVNLPSIESRRAGTLTALFTHRFQQPVQDSTIQDLWSFDNGANIGIGLWYAPIDDLDVGFYRSSELDVYEVSAQYRLPLGESPFGAAVRVGGDWRTERNLSFRSSVFAQAVLAVSFGKSARLTAVPTYISRINGQTFFYTAPVPGDRSCEATDFETFLCSGLYDDIFNVPIAASVALTHSITLHGEVTPRIGKANAGGVGWVVSLEKSVLRHRFAFTAGNQRQTTVDQYAASIPLDQGARHVYLGFNIARSWKLN